MMKQNSRRGRHQKTPRLPFLATEDWPLPHRKIFPVDDQSPGQPRAPVRELPSVAMPAESALDSRLEETRKLPGLGRERDRTKIAELLADERCSQAVLVFLATTDVGRTSGPSVAEGGDGAASEASEWENRETRIAERGRDESGGAGLRG